MQPSITSDRLKQMVSLIDLTNLNDDCDEAAIETLCTQAYTSVGPVAAICIWPQFIETAKQTLESDAALKIATVVNFPSGAEPTESTCEAIDKALQNGADEIDYVLPYTQLMNGNVDQVATALQTVRQCIPDHAVFKVILETGVLGTTELISLASKTAIAQGADFIKTSTGKVQTNATIEAANTMLQAIGNSQRNVGFKAAGGIKTAEDANDYIQLAEDKFGDNWVSPTVFRFGASGLLQNLLNRIDNGPAMPTTNNTDY